MWFVNRETFKMFVFVIGCFCDWEDRALQECNLSAQSSVDCGCIRSWRCPAGRAGSFLRKPWSKALNSLVFILNWCGGGCRVKSWAPEAVAAAGVNRFGQDIDSAGLEQAVDFLAEGA